MNYIEGGWPGSNPKDLEFFRQVRGLVLKHARLAAFGATRRPHIDVRDDANLKALLEAQVPAVTLVGKSWDFHVTEALNTTLAENLAMTRESVGYLKSHRREVIFDAEHFFDGYKRNPDYALAILKEAQAAGADWLVLCDTNGGCLPHEIQEICARVLQEIKTARVGIHTHNDGEMAVANTLAAVVAGVRQVQGTMNGYGERCGNANLCSLIPNLQLKMDYQCLPPGKMGHLTEVSRYIGEVANMGMPANQPFVGSSAFAHKGGLHVSAIRKQPHTYEHICPEAVGNQRRVLVSELSGQSNLLFKSQELGWDFFEKEQGKNLLEKIKELEFQGYQFEGAEASLELLLRKALGEYRRQFRLESLKIIVEKRPGLEIGSEAVLKVRVGDDIVHTAAEGNGPVSALDNALRKALESFYPVLKAMHLTDYKVRVLDGQDGTSAKVRVLIESRDATSSWSTVGVSENIIEASWQALIDSMDYALWKQKKVKREAN
jgi:2-isopropylmalate synthase